jgi:capsular polysaccharide export protein
MGILALTFGVPVVAMGYAIYDMPRLTFQSGLNDFWTQGRPPDADAFDAFRRVVAARTQVNGGFYSDMGLTLAVDGAVSRFEAAIRDYPVKGVATGEADDAWMEYRLSEPRRGSAAQAWGSTEAIPE